MKSTPALPPTTRWLLAFQACNACNFTIALSAPMVLTARHLGANEFDIGLMSALPVLLTALQLFATNLVDRLGYRRIMLIGWSSRSFMLLLIAPLPFLIGVFPPRWLVWGMILPLAGYSAIRGFASGAWLPWLTQVLPPGQRGNYLGREQRVMNIGTFGTLVVCSVLLDKSPSSWQYAILFVLAWIAGLSSVYFLRKADDTPPVNPQGASKRRGRDVLRGIRRSWAYRPFRRAMLFIFVYLLAMSAVPAFLVLFAKEELHFSARQVLVFQAANALGVFMTAVYWGALSDRAGSRPLLRISDIALILIVFYWFGAAFKLYSPSFVGALVAYLAWGVFSAAHAVAQARLVLGCNPRSELTVGMAFYQVVAALSGGVSPLVTGMILNRLRSGGTQAFGGGGFAFVIVFGIALALALISQMLLSRVPEMRATRTHKLLIQVAYDWPIKVLSGVYSRK